MLGLLACAQQSPTPGSEEVEARRKSPFEASFDVAEHVVPPGVEVPLTLQVRAAVAAPAGVLRLEVPAGVVLIDGPVTTPLEAWALDETRTFRWVVRPETTEERVVVALVEAHAGDAVRVGAFGTTFHPAPAPGRSEEGPEGRRKVVRLPAR